jgi:hypothetical protein
LDREIKCEKIGFIKYKNLDYSDEEKAIEKEAKDFYNALDVEIEEIELELKDMPNHITLIYDFKVDLNHYLSKYKPDNIRTLKDLIAFNDQDARTRLKYGQRIFTAS